MLCVVVCYAAVVLFFVVDVSVTVHIDACLMVCIVKGCCVCVVLCACDDACSLLFVCCVLCCVMLLWCCLFC